MQPFKSFPFLIFLILLFSACIKYEPKKIAPLEIAHEFESRSLKDENLSKFIESILVDGDGKHEAFNPKISSKIWDLNRLTLAAIYFNPDIQVALAQWKIALAQIETAGESPNPSISLFPQFISNPKSLPSWAYTFNLDIPIETANKKKHRVDLSTANAEALRYHAEETAWGLRIKVRDALIQIFKTREADLLSENESTLLEHYSNTLSKQSQNVVTSKFQRMDSENSVSHSNLKLKESNQQLLEAMSALANAVGVPLSAIEDIKLDLKEFERPVKLSDQKLAEARKLALQGRYTILAALANYEASSAALALEVAKQYPDFRLNPNYVWFQGQNRWGIGTTGQIPIFNQNEGPIHEAEARREEAKAKFIAVQNQIIGEIDLRTISYKATLKNLEAANESLALQIKNQKSIKKLLRPGDISRLSLLQSNLNINTARTAKLNALVQSQIAYGNLENAFQIPLANDQ